VAVHHYNVFAPALAWDPENAKAHYDLAAALKATGQLEEAAHELQIVEKLNPAIAAPR
jgi:cytochrome c-type biogenesis protein CcmH/NrfG